MVKEQIRDSEEQMRVASKRDAKSLRADTSKRRDKSRFKSRLFDTALSLLFESRIPLPVSIFSRSSLLDYSHLDTALSALLHATWSLEPRRASVGLVEQVVLLIQDLSTITSQRLPCEL